MRKLALIFALIVALLSSAWSKKEDSLEQLKARLETASPDKRISIALEIAKRQLDAADKLYTDGKPEDARVAINDVVSFCEKAGETATQTGKKLKQSEISVRKMAHRLTDLKRSVNFEDQQPIQDAADRLEHVRTELLTRMFGPNKK